MTALGCRGADPTPLPPPLPHSRVRAHPLQIDKVVQLYEIMLTRHTTMVVGPTSGGKSVVISTLQAASGPAFDKSIKVHTINPKAQSVNELYGTMDPVTRDWNDGVLSKLFRTANEPLPQVRVRREQGGGWVCWRWRVGGLHSPLLAVKPRPSTLHDHIA